MNRILLSASFVLSTMVSIAQWQTLPTATGYDFKKCSFVTDQHGFAIATVMADGSYVLLETTDGGMSWQVNTAQSPIEEGYFDVHFVNSQTGYMSLRGTSGLVLVSRILRTDNGGQSWAEVTPSGLATGTGLAAITALDADHVMHGIGDQMHTTADGGQNWELYTFDGLQPTSLSFFDQQTGAVGLWDGTFNYGGSIAWTIDGQNFNMLPWTGLYNQIASVQQIGPLEIVGLSRGEPFQGIDPTLYRTTNGGAAWDTLHLTFLSSAMQSGLQILAYPDEKRLMISGGTSGQIHRSDDRGSSWVLEKDTITPLTCLCRTPTDGAFALGNGGLALHLVSVISGNEDVITMPQLHIYPNPTDGSASVSLPLGTLMMTVRDMAGRVIVQRSVIGHDRTQIMGLAPGLYSVETISSNANTNFGRLMVR